MVEELLQVGEVNLSSGLSELRANLLGSLFDESALKPALSQFASLCNAPVSQLMIADGVVVNGQRSLLRSTFSLEMDEELVKAEQSYQHINPRVLAIPKLRIGRAQRDQDFISLDEIRKDQTYQELIIPAGLGFGSLVPIVQSSSMVAGIALHRPLTADPFSDDDAKVHEVVSSVCTSVFELADKITNRNQRSVLDMFGSDRAAAIFDHLGRLVDHNEEYERLCRRRGYGPHKGKRPDFVRREALPHWMRAISDQTGKLQLSLLDGGQPFLFCSILPTPHVGAQLYLSRNVVALFREELTPNEVDQGALQRDFTLTPAEAETAIFLACGYSVLEVSQKRGVSIETTRSQIKRALSKTGKRSQAELVGLVTQYRAV